MHPIAVETLQESQQFIVNNENVDKRKPVLCIKEGEKELDWILISSSHWYRNLIFLLFDFYRTSHFNSLGRRGGGGEGGGREGNTEEQACNPVDAARDSLS